MPCQKFKCEWLSDKNFALASPWTDLLNIVASLWRVIFGHSIETYPVTSFLHETTENVLF